MFHEATYQGLIVRFTLLEEVFPSLVCARAKSEFSNHSVSLSTLAHMQVVESTLTRVVKPRAHRHLVPFLLSVQLYRSSATFHTGWCTEFTLICPQLLLLSAPCALSLLVQSFPSPPCSSSQDDGRSPRVDHRFIFAFSQPYGAISLSHCLFGQQHLQYLLLHLFKTRVKRLLLYCLSDTPWRFHVVICFNSFFLLPSFLFLRFFIYSPIAVAQIFLSHSLPAWRPRVGVNFPQPYRRLFFLRDCRHCR